MTTEEEYLAKSDEVARAHWQAYADLWEIGRNYATLAQVTEPNPWTAGIVVKPWKDLTFEQKWTFGHNIQTNHTLLVIGGIVGMVTIFVDDD